MRTPAPAGTVITRSAEETEAVGRAWAASLGPGQVVGLYGDLGAGKTCWVRGLAAGLGATQTVSSPTFTLLHEYPARIPLFHFDCYRLNHSLELEDIGFFDYCSGRGICVLEWAEKVEALLPADAWRVRFEIVDEHTRRITLIPPKGTV